LQHRGARSHNAEAAGAAACCKPLLKQALHPSPYRCSSDLLPDRRASLVSLGLLCFVVVTEWSIKAHQGGATYWVNPQLPTLFRRARYC
jgi:hypothetical protein